MAESLAAPILDDREFEDNGGYKNKLGGVRAFFSHKQNVVKVVIALSAVIGLLVIILAIILATKGPKQPQGQHVPEYCSTTLRAVNDAGLAPGYCAWEYSYVPSPRGIRAASNGDLLVVSGEGKIFVIWDENKDGFNSPSEQAVLVEQSGLNHALEIHDGYLYASSSTTVYRWLYTDGTRTKLTGQQTIITNIPSGGHATRGLAFDPQGRLYVQVGSGSNVDSSPVRAAIHRFLVTQVSFPIDWNTGEVWAEGMRNEVGIRFDKDGRLWGVENGVDNENRPPWGDVHNDNPCEELNNLGSYLDSPGKFYGYPYCWSEYLISSGKGPKTQWAQPDFMNDGVHNDAWCQNTSNVVPPALCLPAHVAPLDIFFYYGQNFATVNTGDAFVTMHGSWNRNPPQGYRVVHVPFKNGQPMSFEPILYYAPSSSGGSQTGGGWLRPVALATAPCNFGHSGECLFVTSDFTSQVIAIASNSTQPQGA